MDIKILGAHNSETETTGCICLLINDTLAIDAGSLTSTLSISNQQKIEAILLSHQHYDHIRDVPAIALNLSHHGSSIDVYATPEVSAVIETHLLNGIVYPKFHELPQAKPTVQFKLITPYETFRFNGYQILAVPVNHGDTTVGYQVSDAEGKSMFYTADTGPELLDCWQHVSPQLLIADVTVPNRYGEFARRTGHLTPRLLGEELAIFRELKGYLPQVIAVHMDATLEQEIKNEIVAVAETLHTSISVAHEGMKVHI